MEPIRKINDDLSIAGQITLDQVKTLAREGIHSVVNLRSPTEQGFLVGERASVEFADILYLNYPVKPEEFDARSAIQLLEHLRQLPTPVLLHCDSAMRAAAIALLWVATQHGATVEQALQQAIHLGLLEVPVESPASSSR
jgi:uncharacterized protein (TIGR01244 family)